MKKRIWLLPALTAILAGATIAQAQEMMGPPKVLVITREVEKVGKSRAHEANEHAWAAATGKANAAPYIAVNAITGVPRELFLSGFDSMAAWEKDTMSLDKNAAYQAAIASIQAKENDLLNETSTGVFLYSPDTSYSPPNETPIPQMRYFMISSISIKPGHGDHYNEIRKMIKAAHEKAGMTDGYVMYHMVSGGPTNFYLLFVPLKSLADLDGYAALHQNQAYRDAVGDEGRKKIEEFQSQYVESAETQIFAFNPKMSNTPKDWIKADPDFWAPKMAAPAKPKAAAKETPKP